MSLTVFLAICILGCDFLLYVLFQWVYGEKRRNRLHRSATSREESRGEEPRVLSFPQYSIQHRTGYF
jgi:hypothetical protein